MDDKRLNQSDRVGGRNEAGQHDSNKGDPQVNDSVDAGIRVAQPSPSGLQASGEFRIGEHIILGMRGNDILLRHSPQGDEVTISEETVAAILIDAFFNPQSKDYQKNIARD
jgi:hypothetical protein